MVKAILYKDVRPGDVVEVAGGAFKVERIENGPPVPPGFLILWLETGLMTTGHPDSLIGLLRRPLPEGKTEEGALELLLKRAEELGYRHSFSRQDRDEAVAGLREALDAYELGKSETARTLGVSSDPREAEIDASCGYLGGGGIV